MVYLIDGRLGTEITYTDVLNPRWGNKAKEYIYCDVNFGHVHEETVLFCARADDCEAHGREIYQRCVDGDFGPVGDYDPLPDITGDEAMSLLREARNNLMSETDFWALPDSPEMTEAQAAYRQALRDLPANNPNALLRYENDNFNSVWVNVTWPTKPE